MRLPGLHVVRLLPGLVFLIKTPRCPLTPLEAAGSLGGWTFGRWHVRRL